METTPQQQPIKKYKVFTYKTDLAWTAERRGITRSDGKPDIEVSSPPEFKGTPNLWTPEDFFVSSVEQCTMTTFLAFGLRKGIPLRSYKSAAVGTLEHVEGKYAFTTITITPEVVVGKEWTREQVEELFRQAHDSCLIANSISATVVIEPNIIIV